MFETIATFWAEYGELLLEGTRDTMIMVVISTVCAYIIGLPLGVLLSISQPHGIWPHKWFNRILGWIINVGRSLPFIILMVAIMPFTKLVVGTKIGVKGAIVPLVVSAAPFIARYRIAADFIRLCCSTNPLHITGSSTTLRMHNFPFNSYTTKSPILP